MVAAFGHFKWIIVRVGTEFDYGIGFPRSRARLLLNVIYQSRTIRIELNKKGSIKPKGI